MGGCFVELPGSRCWVSVSENVASRDNQLEQALEQSWVSRPRQDSLTARQTVGLGKPVN